MPDPNERDAKLIQLLSEAHVKERELETALQLHIGMTTKKPYKKRLQEHLRETKRHAKAVERRMKQLGGGGGIVQAATTVAGKGRAAAKGQLDVARGLSPIAGTGEAEQMLKNARQEYTEEAQEIAVYTTILAFSEKVGDADTAKVAREILREEQRMAKFLEGQIKTLTGALVQEEVPAAQRRKAPARRRKASASTRKSSASSTKSSGASKSSSSKKSSSRSRKPATRRKAAAKS